MAYYIGPRCSACHSCFQECPVGAIRFVGTSYEINELTCIGCGKCAEVCPFGLIYEPEKVKAPLSHPPAGKFVNLIGGDVYKRQRLYRAYHEQPGRLYG